MNSYDNNLELERDENPQEVLRQKDIKKLKKLYQKGKLDDFFNTLCDTIHAKTGGDLEGFKDIYFWDRKHDSQIRIMIKDIFELNNPLTPHKAAALQYIYLDIQQRLDVSYSLQKMAEEMNQKEEKIKRNILTREKRAIKGEIGAQKIYQELCNNLHILSNSSIKTVGKRMSLNAYILRAFKTFFENNINAPVQEYLQKNQVRYSI